MPKYLRALALAAGSVAVCLLAAVTCVASPVPMWPGQSTTSTEPPKKSDTSGSGTKKDGEKISSTRMGTNATSRPTPTRRQGMPSGTTTHANTSAGKSGGASTSGTNKAGSSGSGSKPATSSSADTKKDADKVSDDRMSTRGLKPPAKSADTDKNSKPDAKPDTTNPN